MEDRPDPNLAQVLPVISDAEVFVLVLRTVGLQVLVDTRLAENDPPLVQFVPRVRFWDQHYRDLGRKRPALPAPKEIVALEWPHTIRTLVQSGVWAALVKRVDSLGLAANVTGEILEKLQEEEHEEEIRALRGDRPYRTLARRPE